MQQELEVKFRLTSEKAVMPFYSKPGDCGLDLTCSEKISCEKEGYIEYDTHVQVEIPLGYVGLLFPRSSATKFNQLLGNCVGVIDSNYRGNLKFRYRPYLNVLEFLHEVNKPQNNEAGLINYSVSIISSLIAMLNKSSHDIFENYNEGDRIGQLLIIPLPQIKPVMTDVLSETNRGSDAYGSSGK